jgi:hypothetical protein
MLSGQLLHQPLRATKVLPQETAHSAFLLSGNLARFATNTHILVMWCLRARLQLLETVAGLLPEIAPLGFLRLDIVLAAQ